MAIWKTSSNQTLYDLAIQLYGDVTYAYTIMVDNNLQWNYQSATGDEIYYETSNVDTAFQRQLVADRIIISTGFQTDNGIPPFIQRSYNNDFSLDFD
jgi:hypothetical protein